MANQCGVARTGQPVFSERFGSIQWNGSGSEAEQSSDAARRVQHSASNVQRPTCRGQRAEANVQRPSAHQTPINETSLVLSVGDWPGSGR
jgi:hypothetical protein